MIRRIGLNKTREAPIGPVELAAIHDDTANRCAMAADELGSRMYHDIGTMLEWLDQVRCWQRIVYHQRYSVLMRDIGYSLNVQRVQARITQCFSIYSLRALVYGSTEVFRIAAIDKTYVDTKLGQCIVEEIIGTAIEAGRGDNLVAGLGNIQNSQRLRRLA